MDAPAELGQFMPGQEWADDQTGLLVFAIFAGSGYGFQSHKELGRMIAESQIARGKGMGT